MSDGSWDAQTRLKSLEDFAKLVTSVGRSDRVLELTAREAQTALRATTVSLSVWEHELGRWRTLVNVGELGPGEVTFPQDEVYLLNDYPLEQEAMLSGLPYIADLDETVLPAHPAAAALVARLGKQSALGVPVFLDGRVWGELYATRSDEEEPFRAAEFDFAVAVASQVSAAIGQAEHVAHVQHLAYTDPLTGLANRRAFTDRVDAALAMDDPEGLVTAMIAVDLNGLKRLNDEHGHDAGDAALKLLGRVLTQSMALWPGAVAGRIGGDEFCILLERVAPETVAALATDLCARADRVLGEGIACGVATTADMSGDVRSSLSFFRLADAAQYRAKRGGFTTPVFATDFLSIEEFAPPHRDRRTFRGRDDHDIAGILNGIVDALAMCQTHDMVKRIACAADVLTTAAQGVSWFVSERSATSDRILTREGGVVRRPDDVPDDAQYPAADPGFFAVDDFPQTQTALSGRGVYLSIDDPEADPREVELIAGESCTQILMVGGTTRTGTSYLLEIYGDAHTPSLGAVTSLAQASVAMALFS